MWPFAKLLNGFSSHRYVYSPIFLDSQELSTFYFHTHFSQSWVRQSCNYYSATGRGHAMEWRCRRLPSQVPWQLQVQHLKMTMVIGFLPMGNGNAYDQLLSQVPAAGPAPGTMLREWRVSAMGNGECSPGSQTTLRGTLAGPSIY
jgi:hypothetical protein